MKNDLNVKSDLEPRIVAFCGNWCSYAGGDNAGTSRLQYPPSVRLIRTMCSGREYEATFTPRVVEERACSKCGSNSVRRLKRSEVASTATAGLFF